MLPLMRSLPLSFALNLMPRMLEMAFQSFRISKFSGGALGTFIAGRLGTSLAACRDNNKHGGRVSRMVNANSSREIDQVLSFAP